MVDPFAMANPVHAADVGRGGERGIMKKNWQKMAGGMVAAIMLVGCAGGPNERSTGQVIDDTSILAKTKAALVNDPEIKGTAIDVDVHRGQVTLTGVARSEAEKKKIVATAWGVDGVRSVQTNIAVKPPNP